MSDIRKKTQIRLRSSNSIFTYEDDSLPDTDQLINNSINNEQMLRVTTREYSNH